MNLVLGLDIGIASVGWCVLDEGRKKIAGLGVRVFPVAENPKDGAPLALPRRLARSARRRLKRRRERLDSIRGLIVSEGLASSDEEISRIFARVTEEQGTPYQLRAEGLDRRLTDEEWIRVLLHIAKHRGFKSNRRSAEEKDKEAGKMLGSVKDNEERLKEKGYRTVGEMLFKDPDFAASKRNRGGDYSHTVSRSSLADEAAALFAAQRAFGSVHASESFEKNYIEQFTFQHPFATGKDILAKVGPCTLEKDEKRAPKMSYTAGLFTLLTTLNHIRLTEPQPEGGYAERSLSDTERRELISMAHSGSGDISYAQIRKKLDLPAGARFIGLRYDADDAKNVESAEKKKKISVLQGYHAIRKALGKERAALWDTISSSPDILDRIALILTTEKSDDAIAAALNELFSQQQISPEAIPALTPRSFQKFMHLSVKAMRRINPYLEQGLTYDKACAAAGYAPDGQHGALKKTAQLPTLEQYMGSIGDELRNPVVGRALSQVRKVVNEIMRVYGPMSEVHIEFAREIKKSFAERLEIEKKQKENQTERESSLKDLTKTFNSVFSEQNPPKGGDLLKYRLFKEQGGVCAYSLAPFSKQQLFEPGYAEIDHILPYSRSFNDGMSNKVLVLCSENRNKGSRTPWEYFGHDAVRWERFSGWVRSTIKNAAKQRNLLRTAFGDDAGKEMRVRNLSDTSYIARLAAAWISDTLLMADDAPKRAVRTLSGGITAHLRRHWGVNSLKDREKNNLHHALDAAVIAAATPRMVETVTAFSQTEESRLRSPEPGHRRPWLPEPWPGFRHELRVLLSDDPQNAMEKTAMPASYSDEDKKNIKAIFVSWMPDRKATGEAHDQTIRSTRKRRDDQRGCVISQPLAKLKLKDLDKMVGKERDTRLYEALKKRLKEFDDKPEKAFAEPFRKPTNDGRPGPVVRAVKVYDSTYSGVEVRDGLAGNGGMVRVDVYTKGGKFYLVPQYIANVAQHQLKTKAIVQGKAESEWTQIDESFDFCFSLCRNDLVKVTDRKGTCVFGYYLGTDRATGAIGIIKHDASSQTRVGVKTCLTFEKYIVTPLGEYHKVRKEPRPEGKAD